MSARKIVPLEPTEEMVAAGVRVSMLDMAGRYAAMISVCPSHTEEDVERVAQAIHDSPAFYGGDPLKRKWVERGNSNMQDVARRLARAAIAAMLEE